ncbi:MAG: MBL fold metallo-hydrolase [Clostridia bacterium]|nr:MBL fold metallo-hydrolase [Clostridia bacterium]
MKITVLLENTAASPDMAVEHGLSLFIETETKTILFDMGQTDLFAENAGKLGCDLTRVDAAVLSHGHYDHGGGLKHFLEINSHAPVYLSPHAFEPHYNGSDKYIGLDTALMENERLIRTEETREIGEGMTLYTCRDKCGSHGLGTFGLQMERDGMLVPEDFRHEQYLLMEEGGRRILFSGCSHRGIPDIADWFRPDVLIGGFHVSKMTPGPELDAVADALNRFDTEYYTCHCTGVEQFAYLTQRMPRVHYLACGDKLVL